MTGVLVAGSSGGIGGACVRRLTADGVAVLGVDRDSGYDITVPGGAEQAVRAAVDACGGLRGVVHAVGMSGRRLGDGPVTSATDQGWAEVLRVNLESAFWLLRAALPILTDGGSIVVVGSVLAQRTDPDFLTAAYAASKSGLDGLVRVAAREAAPRQVRVNCIAAGLVDTPMAQRALTSRQISERLPELQPLGRTAVSADEIASVAAWLLSDDAAAITGACIPVDRGWSLR